MGKYKWIFGLFIPIAAIPIIVIALLVILKIYERLYNKLFKKLDENDVFSGASRKPNSIVVNITKIMIEILVGLTTFAVCVRILSLPIYLHCCNQRSKLDTTSIHIDSLNCTTLLLFSANYF